MISFIAEVVYVLVVFILMYYAVEGGGMSNIKISKKVMTDLLKGKATYIKKGRMTFDQICFSKDKITFGTRMGSVLAIIEIPWGVDFNCGETVTVNFEGSMNVHLTGDR